MTPRLDADAAARYDDADDIPGRWPDARCRDRGDARSHLCGVAQAAHANGLAIAQKNSAEIVGRRVEMGTDFAVAEECDRYSECDAYTGAYGDHVLVIEYRRRDFDAGCAAFPNLSIVLRDLDLVTPSSKDYVFDGC